jgi:hypothetical protein
MSDTPVARSAAVRDDVVSLKALAPRIQDMIRHVLAHQELLCAYPSGALELHFRHESVKPKVVCSPEG